MDIGPCTTWPVIWCCDITRFTTEALANALDAATEVLWALSGRQFGECIFENLRPCREECGNAVPSWMPQWSYANGYPYPALINGSWYNLGCGGSCDGGCSCNSSSQFTLPTVATRIINITIDGSVVPTGSYHLYNHQHVVRADGQDWPSCNDLSVTSGEGAWSVSFAVGAEVPVIGQLAVGELACEIAKLCADEDCRLPANARRVTRQGVTVDTPELTQIITQHGALGLPRVALFIAAFNPSMLTSRSRSYSPDVYERYLT